MNKTNLLVIFENDEKALIIIENLKEKNKLKIINCGIRMLTLSLDCGIYKMKIKTKKSNRTIILELKYDRCEIIHISDCR